MPAAFYFISTHVGWAISNHNMAPGSPNPNYNNANRNFSRSNSGGADQSPWKQVASPKMSQDPNGIQWAGENHKRQTFKKTKDFIGDWTNVLFRA